MKKSIRELIQAKKAQIALLERHVRMLEQMAAEEETGDQASRRRAGRPPGPRGPRRRRRRRGRSSRAELIGAYLTEHSGQQPAKEIAAALGFRPAEVHSAVHPGLKTGRFARGNARGSYALGSKKTAGAPARKRKKRSAKGRRRKTAKRRTAAAAKPSGPSDGPA